MRDGVRPMRTVALILAAAFMLAGAASAQQAPPAQPTTPPANFTPPVMIQSPTEAEMMAMYPPDALSQGVVGHISTICLIGADGVARDCTVESATPQGWGFDEAGLRVARSLRYEPAQREGRPTPVRIRRGVQFRPDERGSPLDHLTAEMRAMVVDWPLPETPAWDESPTATDVWTAFPAAARDAGVAKGRAVLSCRANPDRTLACEPHAESQANLGFAETALMLSRRFRIADYETAFVAAHATTPFLLPVNFGFNSTEEPLSTVYSGARPIHLQAPPDMTRNAYPERARLANTAGEVDMLCTLTTAVPQCTLEREEPAGWEFGSRVTEVFANASPLPADQMNLLPGDQLRITVHFQPQ